MKYKAKYVKLLGSTIKISELYGGCLLHPPTFCCVQIQVFRSQYLLTLKKNRYEGELKVILLLIVDVGKEEFTGAFEERGWGQFPFQ